MLINDALLYALLCGALTVASAGFALWSYQLNDQAKPPHRPQDEENTFDLRPGMRAAAYRDNLSRAATATQWIAGLLVIAVVPTGLAPLYISGGLNLVALAALVSSAGTSKPHTHGQFKTAHLGLVVPARIGYLEGAAFR